GARRRAGPGATPRRAHAVAPAPAGGGRGPGLGLRSADGSSRAAAGRDARGDAAAGPGNARSLERHPRGDLVGIVIGNRKGEMIMLGQKLTKRAPYCLVLFLALAGGPAAVAGGFYLSLEPPTSQTDTRLKDAILIARAGGCIDPAQAVLRATAEG